MTLETRVVAGRPKFVLDAEHWRPPLQFHPRTVPVEVEDVLREYRATHRPFRRAFGGGERHRKILLAVGESNAKRWAA